VVEMLDVGPKDPFQVWRRPWMSVQSRHSARTVPTHLSAKAFAFGARIGVQMILVPSALNTASKEPENLVSRSWIRKRGVVPCSSSVPATFRACWVTQAESGFPGRSGHVHPPGPELHEEQHIQRPKPDRLHGEEVAGDDP